MEINNNESDITNGEKPRNNSIKLKNYQGSNNRYFQNGEGENTEMKFDNNYIDIFNEVVKSIDKIIFYKEKKDLENEENLENTSYKKSNFMYDSINEEEIDYTQLSKEIYNIIFKLYSNDKKILLIKNNYENNLAQYYVASGLILVSLEIIKIYQKIYLSELEGEKKFIKWLINDNNDGKNILENAISAQVNPKELIFFYKNIFDIIEQAKDKKIIYRILEKRKENIFLLCVKEEKLFLLLFFYEKIKKYYPSSNPLNIKNKQGLTPLHLSCYYLNREIVDALLVLNCNINVVDNNNNIPLHFAVKGGDLSIVKKILLHGGDRNQPNNKDLTPIDYANKYGNYTMKNLFTNNPLNKVEKIKDKKNDKLLFLLYFGCFVLKYSLYHSFWKSYILDIFSFFAFLYISCKKKDYYFNSNSPKPSKDKCFEDLFVECNYDKNKIKRICPKCRIIKSISMKHCMVCDVCIDDFDHHCFWIDKCINNNIYKEFIFFLVVLLINLIINFGLFFIQLKNLLKRDVSVVKNYIYYLKLFFLVFYLLIFAFGISMISMLLLERIKARRASKKVLTLEENLLNKNENEEKNDKSDINELNDVELKLKEENKEEEVEIKDLLK